MTAELNRLENLRLKAKYDELASVEMDKMYRQMHAHGMTMEEAKMLRNNQPLSIGPITRIRLERDAGFPQPLPQRFAGMGGDDGDDSSSSSDAGSADKKPEESSEDSIKLPSLPPSRPLSEIGGDDMVIDEEVIVPEVIVPEVIIPEVIVPVIIP